CTFHAVSAPTTSGRILIAMIGAVIPTRNRVDMAVLTTARDDRENDRPRNGAGPVLRGPSPFYDGARGGDRPCRPSRRRCAGTDQPDQSLPSPPQRPAAACLGPSGCKRPPPSGLMVRRPAVGPRVRGHWHPLCIAPPGPRRWWRTGLMPTALTPPAAPAPPLR